MHCFHVRTGLCSEISSVSSGSILRGAGRVSRVLCAQRRSIAARLAGFSTGPGLTSVLVENTLNLVMIVALGLPASFVGLFFAVPLLATEWLWT